MQCRRPHRSRCPLWPIVAAAAWLWAAAGRGAPQQPAPADIETARAALEQWVQTQRLIAQERQDLVLARELLQERIALVQREIDSLREKIAQSKTELDEADRTRTEVTGQRQRLQRAAESLAERAATLEARLTALLTRLPEPLRRRIEPLARRLPDPSGPTRQPLTERFQTIVGILNEADKFQRELTTTSEVRTLEGGDSAEVITLYLGLGQGYYLGAGGARAGVGVPGDAGWTWRAAPDAAEAIARALAILKNEQPAAFVPLPVDVK